MIVVNFGHPLTDDQRAQVEALAEHAVERVIDVPTHFDDGLPFAPQAATLVERAGLTPREWQTLPLVVNLPSYGPIVAVLLAYLHGLLGHFPTVVRLRATQSGTLARFEVAEFLSLNDVRSAARQDRSDRGV